MWEDPSCGSRSQTRRVQPALPSWWWWSFLSPRGLLAVPAVPLCGVPWLSAVPPSHLWSGSAAFSVCQQRGGPVSTWVPVARFLHHSVSFAPCVWDLLRCVRRQARPGFSMSRTFAPSTPGTPLEAVSVGDAVAVGFLMVWPCQAASTLSLFNLSLKRRRCLSLRHRATSGAGGPRVQRSAGRLCCPEAPVLLPSLP